MKDEAIERIQEATESLFSCEEAEMTGRLQALPQWLGDLVLVDSFTGEVLNGGITQYFLNSAGCLAPELAEAVERIGFGDAAADIREMIGIFGSGFPRLASDRERALAKRSGCSTQEWSPYDPDHFEDYERRLTDHFGENHEKLQEALDAYADEHAC